VVVVAPDHSFLLTLPYHKMRYNSLETSPNLWIKQANHYLSLPIEYDIWKESIKQLDQSWEEVSKQLNAYPKTSYGLTSQKDDRWSDLRKISDILRKTIQLLNKRVPKSFMLRSRDERRAKREQSTCQ
jgi:hypothetical protein